MLPVSIVTMEMAHYPQLNYSTIDVAEYVRKSMRWIMSGRGFVDYPNKISSLTGLPVCQAVPLMEVVPPPKNTAMKKTISRKPPENKLFFRKALPEHNAICKLNIAYKKNVIRYLFSQSGEILPLLKRQTLEECSIVVMAKLFDINMAQWGNQVSVLHY